MVHVFMALLPLQSPCPPAPAQKARNIERAREDAVTATRHSPEFVTMDGWRRLGYPPRADTRPCHLGNNLLTLMWPVMG